MKANMKQKNTIKESTNNINRFSTFACTIFFWDENQTFIKNIQQQPFNNKNKNINKEEVSYNNSHY